jgi:OPA family glycerol-3-phosphate transporter-like MFS transporter
MVMGFFSLAIGSVTIMFALLFVNGWFQGMGWPPCGRVVVHWFSVKERGAKMSIWNVGGGLMAPIAIAGLALFGTWGRKLFCPAVIALVVALITYRLVRDTPQFCGPPPVEKCKIPTQKTTSNRTKLN